MANLAQSCRAKSDDENDVDFTTILVVKGRRRGWALCLRFMRARSK